jgi:hypothetical protein
MSGPLWPHPPTDWVESITQTCCTDPSINLPTQRFICLRRRLHWSRSLTVLRRFKLAEQAHVLMPFGHTDRTKLFHAMLLVAWLARSMRLSHPISGHKDSSLPLHLLMLASKSWPRGPCYLSCLRKGHSSTRLVVLLYQLCLPAQSSSASPHRLIVSQWSMMALL